MEIFVLSVLIILNGLFVLCEMALVSARKSRLESLANKGDAKARLALKLMENPEKFLSTAQIGLTLIAVFTGLYSGEKFSKHLVPFFDQFTFLQPYADSISTGIIVMVVTFLSIVFGELIPKKLALIRAEKIACIAAGPMQLLSQIIHPFIWLLSGITNLFFQVLNIKKATDNTVTEEEIKAMISEGSEQGSIEEDEKEIIERVFHLGDRSITSLMTHRTDIVWADEDDTVGHFKTKMNQITYSTYPVCKGSIDDVTGLIYVKDLVKADSETSIKSLTRQALFVPENNTAYQVLEKIKATRIHACFIVNEYGTLEGMITLNDILEAIVGDVQQQDQEEPLIIPRENGTYLADALIQFYDFLSYFGKAEWVSEIEQEFDTLAGFSLHQLEHIPKTGETFSWRDFHFEIVDMDGQRIDKIIVSISDELRDEMRED
jgi:putative hemolysin